MRSEAPNPSAPTLAYADSPLRAALTIERTNSDGGLPGGLRIIVPPPRDWRRLSHGAIGAVVVLALLVILFTAAALANWHGSDRDALFANAALYAFVLGIVLLVAHQRLNRTLVLELSDVALAVTSIAPGGRARTTRTWRREDVAAVSADGESENLRLRVRGQDVIELYVGPRAVARRVALALTEAIEHDPPGPAAQAARGATSLGASLGAIAPDPAALCAGAPSALPVVRIEEDPPVAADALPTGRMRTLCWWVFGVLVAVAALFVMTGHLCGAAYVLLLAVAPAGLALGTAEKDVYL